MDPGISPKLRLYAEGASSARTPDILAKFEEVFESYWHSADFVPQDVALEDAQSEPLCRFSGVEPHRTNYDEGGDVRRPGFRTALHEELLEETAELRMVQRPDEVIEELADVWEVVVLAAAHGVPLDRVTEAAAKRETDCLR